MRRKKVSRYVTLVLPDVNSVGKSPASGVQQGEHYLTEVHAGLLLSHQVFLSGVHNYLF